MKEKINNSKLRKLAHCISVFICIILFIGVFCVSIEYIDFSPTSIKESIKTTFDVALEIDLLCSLAIQMYISSVTITILDNKEDE